MSKRNFMRVGVPLIFLYRKGSLNEILFFFSNRFLTPGKREHLVIFDASKETKD